VYSAFETTSADISRHIDTKANYTYPTFRAVEGTGETFLPACWNFITFNLVFVLAGFALLRFGFYALFKYRISIFLRPFSFLIYLCPLLLDGNLQYFFFVMFSQSYLGFSLDAKDKLLNVVSILLFFLSFLFSIVSCFLAYYLSRKLSKYILDNWRSRINGLLGYSLSNAVRMVVFAAIHNFLRFQCDAQLKLLMAAEISYIACIFYALKRWQVHKVEFKLWFAIIFSALRVALQGTLLLQQESGLVGTESPEYYLV
jgi:hypothetical protein